MDGYPVLREDIFFAKIYNERVQVRIRNTTTEKDFKLTPDTVVLLELCTGANTVSEIVDILSKQSGEPAEELAESVHTIVTVLQNKGIITIKKAPSTTRIKEITVKYPLEVAQIEITNKCNLSCLHCFNASGAPHPDELTTQEIFSLLDTLSPMGVYQVTFTGGEPLLHPDIFEIVEHARKAPMAVDIFTNGTLLTEDTIKQFEKLKIRQFNISLDSVNRSIHDTFRGKKGALQQTLQGISLLKEAGLPFKLSICLSQLNKEGITDILKYFNIQSQEDFQIIPVKFSGRNVDGLAVSPGEYYTVLVEQFNYFKRFPQGVFEFSERSGECSIARNTIGIKFDGTVLPCPACHKDMGVGNIRDTDLEKLWQENETLKTLRNMRARNDKRCKSCQYLPFCAGCIAGAFTIERNLTCYHPYICALNKAYDDVFGLVKRTDNQ